jgi:hypothetical protein
MSKTSSSRALDKRVKLGFGPRARISWSRLRRGLHMQAWFPHLPLALAVGLAGLIQLLPYLRGRGVGSHRGVAGSRGRRVGSHRGVAGSGLTCNILTDFQTS